MGEAKRRKVAAEKMAEGAPDKMRVFIATPSGGGAVSNETQGTVELLQDALGHSGHMTTWCRQSYSGLDRTRNIMVADARAGEWTHILWIDRDMTTAVDVLVSMLRAPFDVVGVGYPKKNIDWGRVLRFAEKLLKQPDPDPRVLAMMSSPAVGTLVEPLTIEEWGGRRFALAEELGTGLLAVKMPALESYIRENDERLKYRTDYLGSGKETHHHAVFMAKLGPEPADERRYLTEDFSFTREWKASGRSAYMMLDARVGHVGRYTFYSDLSGLRP